MYVLYITHYLMEQSDWSEMVYCSTGLHKVRKVLIIMVLQSSLLVTCV